MYLCSLICGQGGALAAGEALRFGQADVDATEVACHGLQPPLWGKMAYHAMLGSHCENGGCGKVIQLVSGQSMKRWKVVGLR